MNAPPFDNDAILTLNNDAILTPQTCSPTSVPTAEVAVLPQLGDTPGSETVRPAVPGVVPPIFSWSGDPLVYALDPDLSVVVARPRSSHKTGSETE